MKIRDMIGGWMQQAFGQPADPEQQLIRALTQSDPGLMDKFLRVAQKLQDQQRTNALEDAGRGEGGSLSATQRAWVGTTRSPQQAARNAAVATMTTRGRLLRSAGIDPSEPWVSKMVGGQRDNESPDQYIARAKAAQQQHRLDKENAAQRVRQRTSMDKRAAENRKMRGIQPSAFMMSAEEVGPGAAATPASEAQRRARAQRVAQGRAAPTGERDFADAQAFLRDPGGALPPLPRATRYRAVGQVGSGPRVEGSSANPAALAGDVKFRALNRAGADPSDPEQAASIGLEGTELERILRQLAAVR